MKEIPKFLVREKMAYENTNLHKIKDWAKYKQFLLRQASAGRKVYQGKEKVDPTVLISQLIDEGKLTP